MLLSRNPSNFIFSHGFTTLKVTGTSPSCQSWNLHQLLRMWHLSPGRWGSSAFKGSPSRRRKTPISNFHCLVAISTDGKGFMSKPQGKIRRQLVSFWQLLWRCWNQLYWPFPFHWTISAMWRGGCLSCIGFVLWRGHSYRARYHGLLRLKDA